MKDDRTPLYCPDCERPGAYRTTLGYIAKDGTWGGIAGIACPNCMYIAADRGAPEIPEGRLDLGGEAPMTWLLKRTKGAKPRKPSQTLELNSEEQTMPEHAVQELYGLVHDALAVLDRPDEARRLLEQAGRILGGMLNK